MADVQEPKNALWRREEQLRRWDLSETNKESAAPRNREVSKIKFQDGCIFLAACSSGDKVDKDEVERLIGRGADINTANIDGLTALHQACIDDNLDMVEFLVERGADIDACDNEGWTALHATASCGFLDIAKYLIAHRANVAAVNNDGELPIDIAEGDEMEDILSEEMEARGVDADAARMEEEESMLRDANQLLRTVTSGEELKELIHPKTGASALHIAAAKGYIKVMNILMQAGALLNRQDLDGWTPLHAAAHWGQEDASRILVEQICDMEIKNSAGQTAIDVADSDLQLYLEELKKNQATLKKDKENQEKDVILRPGERAPMKRRSSVTRMSVDQRDKVGQKNAEEEREFRQKALDEKEEEKRSESSADEASTSDSETEENYVVFVPTEKQNEINRQSSISKRPEEPVATPSELLQPPEPEETPAVEDNEKTETKPPPLRCRLQANAGEDEADKENAHTMPVTTPVSPVKITSSVVMRRDLEQLKVREQNTEELSTEEESEAPPGFASKSITSTTTSTKTEIDPASWRAGLRKTGSSSAVPDSVVSKDNDFEKLARSASSPWLAPERKEEQGRKRPVSVSCVLGNNQESKNSNRFNNFYSRYASLVNSNRTNALVEPSTTSTTTSTTTGSPTTTPSSSNSSTSSSSTTLPHQSSYVPSSRRRHIDTDSSSTTTTTSPDSDRTIFSTGTTTTTSTWTCTSTTSPTSTMQTAGQRRSFEPPKRDEERETERKLKARRARESRRSTQGVTKEDLERAEQTLQAATRGTDPPPDKSDDKSDKENKPEDTSLPSTRRRHTWDDKKDDDTRNSSRRSRDSSALLDSTSYLRSRPTSTITSSLDSTTTTTTTPSYRSSAYRSKYSSQRNEDDADKEADKEKEKEDPSQKSSAIRTRRKRENRRPTGKINPEDIQGVRKDDTDDKKEEKKEEDRTSSRYTPSRYSEPTSVYDRTPYTSRADRPTSYSSYRSYPSSLDKDSSLDYKNIDYKKLYEEEKIENERLRKDVKRLQQDISDLKLDLEKAKQKNESRSYDSSTDKRGYYSLGSYSYPGERRALERKLSELEEELKDKDNLKADNARLKEENGALIRVISKLSK